MKMTKIILLIRGMGLVGVGWGQDRPCGFRLKKQNERLLSQLTCSNLVSLLGAPVIRAESDEQRAPRPSPQLSTARRTGVPRS